MTAHEFMGSMTIAMLRLGFEASMSFNQDMITFENKKGNKSYLHNHQTNITLQTFKITKSAHPELKVIDTIHVYKIK
jgi:hypothetical protein